MILKHFPGYGEQSQKNDDFSCFHRQNVVVYAKSSEISYGEHTAPLSIKTCLKGAEIYELRGVPIAVEEDKYLVINNEQPYASRIISNEPVESFCIFFQDGIVQEVLAAFEKTNEYLLNNPEENNWKIPFFQNLQQSDFRISTLLKNLHEGISSGNHSQLWLDEQSANLIEVLLLKRSKTLKEIDKLPMVKQTTRLEIYSRLSLAKDYIESCYGEPVSLRKLAQIACLSQHHFLRLFKAAFHQTPHQYLINVRLQKALKLVKKENLSITDICFSVGFENLSSFIRSFKNRFNLSPLELRGTSRQ